MIRFVAAGPPVHGDGSRRYAWECPAPAGVEGDGWHVCVDKPAGRTPKARWWGGPDRVPHADGIAGPARKVLQVREVGPWRTETEPGAML